MIRPNGGVLTCTPPEHVQAEMERLVAFYEESSGAHPVALAAWLHHRFICIHPFEDGNGRVARALVLLVLLRRNYAPLVVDRDRRGSYIEALDAANTGDLDPLIRLFAELEIVALRSELETPTLSVPAGSGAADVARAYASVIRDTRRQRDIDKRAGVETLATELQRRLQRYLEAEGSAIRDAFAEIDDHARVSVAVAAPPDPAAKHWYAQLVGVARKVDFFTNLADGSWWVRLHLTVAGREMRYVVAVQKVGRAETGVIALTVFAELLPPREQDQDERPLPTHLIDPTSRDSVTLLYSSVLDEHWADVVELLGRTLSSAVSEFARHLS